MKKTIKKQLDLYKRWLKTSKDIAFTESMEAIRDDNFNVFIYSNAQLESFRSAAEVFDWIYKLIEKIMENDDESN